LSETTPSASNASSYNKLLVVVIILSSAGLATLLYWPTLDLPLLYDDLLHIRISGDLDFGSVWLPTDASGFYRPLSFLPLIIIERIFDSYPPLLLHGLNVAQHALNAALLSWLTWRLWNRWHWTLASGLIFALYPFSYQAVTVFGHNVHPVATGLMLLALHTYLSAIRSEGAGRAAWWVLTGLIFILGVFNHESIVLFGAFAALVHFNERGWPAIKFRGQSAVYRQPWVIFLAAGFIYMVVFQFLPLTRTPVATFAAAEVQSKALYILQSAAYPLAWFHRFLSDDFNSSIVLFGFALMLLLSYWASKDQANRMPLLLGWGWWVLATLLVALPLPAGYLLHGPRLLYLASAGAALIWPVLLEPLYKQKPYGRLLWWGILAFIALTSWIFVRGRLNSYALLTRPVAVVEDVMQDRPVDEAILLVNFPQWLSSTQNTYPIGVEFVAMLGDYLFVEELMAHNLGVDRPVQSIKVPDLLTSYDYNYAIHDRDQLSAVQGDWALDGSHIFITTYTEDGPETEYKGAIKPPSASIPPLAQIGPYELVQADASATDCSGKIQLTTTWRPSTPDQNNILPTTSIFAQLLDQEGKLIAQADGPPLGLRPDLLDIPSNWQIIDRRIMSTSEVPAGQVLLGVYDYDSGQRYPVADANQLLVSDNAIHITPNPAPCP
jgi:hypothetical protein